MIHVSFAQDRYTPKQPIDRDRNRLARLVDGAGRVQSFGVGETDSFLLAVHTAELHEDVVRLGGRR